MTFPVLRTFSRRCDPPGPERVAQLQAMHTAGTLAAWCHDRLEECATDLAVALVARGVTTDRLRTCLTANTDA